MVKCKLSIKSFNLLNENVVLNCIPIPQGITSCSRSIIKKLYKEVQSYQFHTNNINMTPRAWILTTKVLKEYFSMTDFVTDTINHAYPGCTGMYLDVAGHMLAFYGKKTNPRAGLLHDQGILASKAIADIPSWMGYPAKWRVQCVKVSEVSEILAGCKRLEKENWRQAHWDLQNRLSSMQLNSTLSATTGPFQPQAASPSALVDNIP